MLTFFERSLEPNFLSPPLPSPPKRGLRRQINGWRHGMSVTSRLRFCHTRSSHDSPMPAPDRTRKRALCFSPSVLLDFYAKLGLSSPVRNFSGPRASAFPVPPSVLDQSHATKSCRPGKGNSVHGMNIQVILSFHHLYLIFIHLLIFYLFIIFLPIYSS